MEYRTIPTTKYSFNYGSYDSSYDISYEEGSTNSEVTTATLVRKLCKLKVKPCGCPEQTEENRCMLFENCGCFINPLSKWGKRCQTYWGKCSNWAGECKISPCGTKLYIRHVQQLEKNHQILVTFQTNGVEIDGEIMVPNYANMCIHTGIEYQKILFNDKYTPVVKNEARYRFLDEQDKIIVHLNPISIEVLADIVEMANW